MHHLQQLVFVLIISVVAVAAASTKAAAAIAKPGCQDRCGNISVPYPFGIGTKECYLDESFKLSCNNSFNPPLLRYSSEAGSKILQVTLDYVRVLNWLPKSCYNKTTGKNPWTVGYSWTDTPFTFSATQNKFTSIGCDIFAYMPSDPSLNSFLTGCASFCNSETLQNDSKISSCLGNNGCCQASISKGLQFTVFQTKSIKSTEGSLWKKYPISRSFIVENGYHDGFERMLRTTTDPSCRRILEDDSKVPVIMDWAVGNKTCKEAQTKNFSRSYVCGFNSSCVDSENGPGYKCICFLGYRGNPYLLHGCQDIDECKDSNGSVCPSDTHCMNTLGDYTCVCLPGYHHEYGTKQKTRCKHIKRKLPVGVVIAIGIGTGIILVLLSFSMYRRLQERKQIILKSWKNLYFTENGGLLLKQKISSHDDGMEKD